MNISALFIARPVATTLLTLGVALAGVVAFFLLPVSPLPQVDFPTILVQASMPGASPETMATSVATPLERHLGQIADVTEMTSSSSVGNTRITPLFHQFQRPYPGPLSYDPRTLRPVPTVPSDTTQFGVYSVRGPW